MKTYWKYGEQIFLSEGVADGAMGRIFTAQWVDVEDLPEEAIQLRPTRDPMEIMIRAWWAANEECEMQPISSLQMALLTEKLLDAGVVFKGDVDE